MTDLFTESDRPIDSQDATAPETRPGFPLAALLELTHRCPLQCPYCSNPLALERSSAELSTAEWMRVLDEAAALGVLQVHFSGGEPTARKDLVPLVAHATAAGLYANLITSGVLLTENLLAQLANAGLSHVQISFQGSESVVADRVGGMPRAHDRKLAACRLVRAADLPLTVNAVVHRQNLHQLADMIALAVELGAARLEVAHVQYYGWALENRAALIPTEAQIEEASRIVEDARAHLRGVLQIDYVEPDYYATRPKACMGGWARQFFTISPSGKVLPCHAAETIPGLSFDTVRDRSLDWIWEHSDAFNAFRGTSWMREPCRSCAFREEDYGGCRCQALALAGDPAATDPTCALSPLHDRIRADAVAESGGESRLFLYRNFAGGVRETAAG